MAGYRIDRVSEDIKREITAVIRELKDPRVMDKLITVVRVEVSSDASYAKVWLSVLGMENEKEFKRGLKSASGWLRRELGASLNLRYTPELVFEIDHSIEQGAYISGLIEKLDTGSPEDEA